MDPFVAQLHELCRAEPTRAKWLLAPGYALGHTVGERLAREGTSWANLQRLTASWAAAAPSWRQGRRQQQAVRGGCQRPG